MSYLEIKNKRQRWSTAHKEFIHYKGGLCCISGTIWENQHPQEIFDSRQKNIRRWILTGRRNYRKVAEEGGATTTFREPFNLYICAWYSGQCRIPKLQKVLPKDCTCM